MKKNITDKLEELLTKKSIQELESCEYIEDEEYDEGCKYSQVNQRYKSVLCKHEISSIGSCTFGDNCSFAHFEDFEKFERKHVRRVVKNTIESKQIRFFFQEVPLWKNMR